MLFYIVYGNGYLEEDMIVDADYREDAEEYGHQALMDLLQRSGEYNDFYTYYYDSDECYDNYGDAEELISDHILDNIYCNCEQFDKKNLDHLRALQKMGGEPLKI